jgi:hypothetical protein
VVVGPLSPAGHAGAPAGRPGVYDLLTGHPDGASVGEHGELEPNVVRLFAEGVPTAETPEEAAVRRSVGGENDSPARQLARYVKEVAENRATKMEVRLVWRRDGYLRGGDQIPFLERRDAAVRFTEPNEDYRHQHHDGSDVQGQLLLRHPRGGPRRPPQPGQLPATATLRRGRPAALITRLAAARRRRCGGRHRPGGALRCGWGQAASLAAMSWLLGYPVVRIAPVAAAVVGRARSTQVIIRGRRRRMSWSVDNAWPVREPSTSDARHHTGTQHG